MARRVLNGSRTEGRRAAALDKHHRDAPAGAVNIGRGGPWGNRVTIGADGDLAFRDRVRTELMGRDLLCFCAPLPCHGDTLLALANPPVAQPATFDDGSGDDGF